MPLELFLMCQFQLLPCLRLDLAHIKVPLIDLIESSAENHHWDFRLRSVDSATVYCRMVE